MPAYSFRIYREEAENATELESATSTAVDVPSSALTVQGNKINRSIKSFADAYVLSYIIIYYLFILFRAQPSF